MRACGTSVLVGDEESTDLLEGMAFVEVSDGACGACASGEWALPVEAVDAGDAFGVRRERRGVCRCRNWRRSSCAFVVSFRIFPGVENTCALALPRLRDGVDERHGHGFEVGGLVVG